KVRCVFPLVREPPPTIPLVEFPVRLDSDNLPAIRHAKRQIQLPILRAMAAKNHSKKSLSPWHANATVRAPAFIKTAAIRQWCCPREDAVRKNCSDETLAFASDFNCSFESTG